MPKPRKKRHPQRETFNPLAAMQPLPTDKVCADMLRNYAALEAMVHGTSATSEEWIDLSDCVNVVEMLIEMGEIDSMHTATSVRAIEAMVASMRRHKEEGQGLGMTANEGQAMRDLLTLYHTCLERKTWMIIYRAQKACQKRADSMKAGRRLSNQPTATPS